MPKKVQKNKKNIFFVLNKYQSVTHVSTSIFQGLFRKIFSRSVALVTNKLWAIIDFFSKTGLFAPCTQPYALKKTNFSKKDKKKLQEGPQTPPPRLFMAKNEETNFFRTCLYGYQKSALGCSFSTFLSFQC